MRATLYNHFRVKEALLDHYFRLEFETGSESLVAEVGKQLGVGKSTQFLVRCILQLGGDQESLFALLPRLQPQAF